MSLCLAPPSWSNAHQFFLTSDALGLNKGEKQVAVCCRVNRDETGIEREILSVYWRESWEVRDIVLGCYYPLLEIQMEHERRTHLEPEPVQGRTVVQPKGRANASV